MILYHAGKFTAFGRTLSVSNLFEYVTRQRRPPRHPSSFYVKSSSGTFFSCSCRHLKLSQLEHSLIMSDSTDDEDLEERIPSSSKRKVTSKTIRSKSGLNSTTSKSKSKSKSSSSSVSKSRSKKPAKEPPTVGVRFYLKQLYALLWKSLLVRRVHFISTFFEAIGPLILPAFIVFIFIKISEMHGSSQFFKDNTEPFLAGPILYNKTAAMSVYFQESDFTTDSNGKYTVLYTPDNAQTKKLVEDIAVSKVQLVGVANETVLREVFSKIVSGHFDDQMPIIGVSFDENIDFKAGQLAYKLFKPSEPEFGKILADKYPIKYTDKVLANPTFGLYYRIVQVLSYINRKYIHLLCLEADKTKTECTGMKHLEIYRMPYPRYKASNRLEFNHHEVIGLIITIGYVLLFPMVVKRVTDEKSIKAKELLSLMGMNDLVFWLSHFLNYFLIVLFQAAVVSVLVCWTNSNLVHHSSFILFFTFVLIYGAQMVMFSLWFSTFFPSPILGVICAAILWVVLTAITYWRMLPSICNCAIGPLNHYRRLLSFLPTGSFTFFMSIFGDLEMKGKGLTFSTLASGQTIYEDFSPVSLYGIVLLSLPMYAVLIFYFDKVWPFQTGIPMSPFFIFLPSYWCPTVNASEKGKVPKRDHKKQESEPKGVAARIQIRDLCKSFGAMRAVDHLWLNIFDRQLTVLLGHNGAGKTTTMNMITGMFSPSSGTIRVNGYDIEKATSAARRSIGLCPQENIYFDELTVCDHLWLFAMLKNHPTKDIPKEIAYILGMLSLEPKRYELAKDLSGGMKRKLALGMALIGDTETLILDEPTSGLDPEARRVIWDLLISIRRSRTILLTTHYMEEADVLADRIIIMNKGQLCCSGSPMFLKNAFGAGYRLRVAKSTKFSAAKFSSHLRDFFPKSELVSEVETEVVYSLEMDKGKGRKKATMQKLQKLFDDIEKNKTKFGIASCGLSCTTLEDVFLIVGSDSKLDGNTLAADSPNGLENSSFLLTSSKQLLCGAALFKSQVFGLLMKRIHFSRRYWQMAIWQMLIPALIMAFALNLTRKGSGDLQEQSLLFNAKSIYGEETETFFCGDKTKDELFKQYKATHEANYPANVTRIDSSSDNGMGVNNWALEHASKSLPDYIYHYLYGLESVTSKNGQAADLRSWFNAEQYHSLPLSLIALFDTLLRSMMATKSSTSSIGFNVTTVALYKLSDTGEKDDMGMIMKKSIYSWFLLCLIFMPIAFPFLGASYVLFPAKERLVKSKLIQLMTGVSPMLYWAVNFVYDLVTHLLATGALFLVIYLFSSELISGNAIIGTAFFVLIFAFGFASIPIAYLFSFTSSSSTSAFVWLTLINLAVGFILGLIVSIINLVNLYVVAIKVEFVIKITTWLLVPSYIFNFVPIFAFIFGYQKVYLLSRMVNVCPMFRAMPGFNSNCIANMTTMKDFMRGCCDNCQSQCYRNSAAFNFTGMGAGIELTMLFLNGLLYMTLIAVYEGSFMQSVGMKVNKAAAALTKAAPDQSVSTSEDGDVEDERKRIEDEVKSDKMTSLLTVHQLTKVFNGFTAVNGLSFGVKENECFGFLGVNGAGKTTTFSMLTGDIIPTGGNAFMKQGQLPLLGDMVQFRKSLGYCPQFDALIEELSGEEILYMFARLRGVPEKNRKRDIDHLVAMVGLQDHRYKITKAYSGGNKRKLSIAIALVGSPSLIMLDEPSAGVDPAARRKIWQLLGYIKRDLHCSVLLTSHSMEECEALCSRIAIMVRGKFMCLGATQHLRHKFGQGYTVSIRLARKHEQDKEHAKKVHAALVELIPSAVLKDFHQCDLHYHVTDRAHGWSAIFGALNKLNDQFAFEDYTVADTTLEQIFISFARYQDEAPAVVVPGKAPPKLKR